MLVNELAKRAGVKPHVVRYYARIGLLPYKRQENGYKWFDSNALDRLQFILLTRNLGISIDDIAKVLTAMDKDIFQSREEVTKLVNRQIEINQRLLEDCASKHSRLQETIKEISTEEGFERTFNIRPMKQQSIAAFN